MRRLLAGLLLSGMLMTVAVPVVAAHECYIVNRSQQGTKGADHSARRRIIGRHEGVAAAAVVDRMRQEDSQRPPVATLLSTADAKGPGVFAIGQELVDGHG